MEIVCLGCRATLRVDDKFMGRQARCPHCGYIQTIQHPSEHDHVSVPVPASLSTEMTSHPASRRPVEEASASDPSVQYTSGRGVLLLVMSLIGLGCSCPVFSIAAWVMSSKDLAAMQRGELDASRQHATRYAYWLGFVGSLLWITISVVVSLVLLIRAGR